MRKTGLDVGFFMSYDNDPIKAVKVINKHKLC